MSEELDKRWIDVRERLPQKEGYYKTLWNGRLVEPQSDFRYGTFFCLVSHWWDDDIKIEAGAKRWESTDAFVAACKAGEVLSEFVSITTINTFQDLLIEQGYAIQKLNS